MKKLPYFSFFFSVKNLIIFQYLYEIISQSIEKLLKIFSPIHPTPKGSWLSWEFSCKKLKPKIPNCCSQTLLWLA